MFISDAGGLASVKLGLEAAVPAPSFPGGLSINNRVGLSDLLNPNCYYMKNGNPVDMTGITTEIAGGVIHRCFEDDSEYQKCDKRFDRYPGGPGDRGSERRRSSGLRKPMYLTLHRTIFPCVRVNFTA